MNKKIKLKKVALWIAAILILGGTAYLIYRAYHKSNKSSIESSAPSDVLTITPEQAQQEAQTNADKKDAVINNTKPGQNTSDGESKTVELSAKQETDNTVTIFTKLSGFSNGTCTLKINNGSLEKTLTADIIYQVQFSTCAGYSVPINDLNKGSWNMTLTAQSGNIVKSNRVVFEVK